MTIAMKREKEIMLMIITRYIPEKYFQYITNSATARLYKTL